MASLAAAVVVPMACCAAIQAVYRQSASMLLRTFLVHLPLSLLLTGVAVTLVRMALAVTDAMSATVLSSAGVDTTNLFSGLFVSLTPLGVTTAGIVPGFVVFIGALLVAVAALVLWLELVVRAAAVSVAVLFLPLALAALVWPAVAHWCRRLADTLVALVLSKLVVAAVLSLAASAIAGGAGVSGSESGGGFAAVVTGIALLVIAVLSPFTLLRLVPAVEAGAVSHLESARHRLKSAATTPARTGGNLALEQLRRTKEQVSQGGSAVSVGAGGVSGADGTAGLDDGDGGDPVGAGRCRRGCRRRYRRRGWGGDRHDRRRPRHGGRLRRIAGRGRHGRGWRRGWRRGSGWCGWRCHASGPARHRRGRRWSRWFGPARRR